MKTVYFVYYTNYYYYVDSVWETREGAQERLDGLLESDRDWDIQEVALNVPNGALHWT